MTVFESQTPTNTVEHHGKTLPPASERVPFIVRRRARKIERVRAATMRQRIAEMAEAHLGWEDIVVRLRRDGFNVDPHKNTIRRFVLSTQTARRPHRGGWGRFSAGEGAGT